MECKDCPYKEDCPTLDNQDAMCLYSPTNEAILQEELEEAWEEAYVESMYAEAEIGKNNHDRSN